MLAERGVTRVSLGVQSLDDAKLRALDRAARRERRDRGRCDCVQAAGLQVSLDLIFAAPGETLDDWRRDLRDAIALAPDHISTYGLTFETRHGVHRQPRPRRSLRELDEELQRAMYAEAIDALTAAGFEHYEVSNFARPGRRSRHNEVYWAGERVLRRRPRRRPLRRRRARNEHPQHAGVPQARPERASRPSPSAKSSSPERRARERLVLGLRRLRGVEQARSSRPTTGYEVDALAGRRDREVRRAGPAGRRRERVRLTREGLFVSDALWPELL